MTLRAKGWEDFNYFSSKIYRYDPKLNVATMYMITRKSIDHVEVRREKEEEEEIEKRKASETRDPRLIFSLGEKKHEGEM